MQGDIVAAHSTVDDYHILRRLGMGAGGAAYLARREGHGQGQVALKFANEIWRHLEVANHPRAAEKSETNRDLIRAEFAIMQMFDHPHILKAYFLNEEGVIRRNGVERQTRHLYSVNQFAEGGTLLFYLMSGRLSEPIAKRIFIQLVTGLQAMHNQRIVHKDLKPDNLLLTSDYSLLIADFGHATQLDANGIVTQDGVRTGTPCYNPPETHDENIQQVRGVPLDLFMAGVLFFIMVSGKPPFKKGAVHTDPYYNFFTTGNPAGFWNRHAQHTQALENVSQETKSLINSLLSPNPLTRPSHQDILAHPSLTQNVADTEEVRAEFENRRALAAQIHQQQEEAAIADEENQVGHFQALQGHHRGIITEECIGGILRENINEIREFIDQISEKTNFLEQDAENYRPDVLSPNVLHYCPLDREDLLKLLAITAVNDFDFSVEDLKESVIENEVTSFNLGHFQHGCWGQHC